MNIENHIKQIDKLIDEAQEIGVSVIGLTTHKASISKYVIQENCPHKNTTRKSREICYGTQVYTKCDDCGKNLDIELIK